MSNFHNLHALATIKTLKHARDIKITELLKARKGKRKSKHLLIELLATIDKLNTEIATMEQTLKNRPTREEQMAAHEARKARWAEREMRWREEQRLAKAQAQAAREADRKKWGTANFGNKPFEKLKLVA